MHMADHAKSEADVQSYLDRMDYPAEKSDLLVRAREHKAPSEVIDMLEQLPEATYNSADHVQQSIGQLSAR